MYFQLLHPLSLVLHEGLRIHEGWTQYVCHYSDAVITCTNSASVSAAARRTCSVADEHCWMIIREDGPETFAAMVASVCSDMLCFVYL